MTPLILWSRFLWAAFFLLFSLISIFPSVEAHPSFLPPEEAFSFSVAPVGDDSVGIRFNVAPSYKLYKDQFNARIEPNNISLSLSQLPAAQVEFDDMFGKDLPVYRNEVVFSLKIPLEELIDSQPYRLVIDYQGCADAGLCYQPESNAVSLSLVNGALKVFGSYVDPQFPVDKIRTEAPVPASESQTTSASELITLSDTSIADYFSKASWLEMMLIAFTFGLLLSFTPCVLPMVPILLSIIGGQKDQNETSKWKGFQLAATYVLGVSIVYTLLGVTAGLAGASFASILQTPWVLSVFALILVILALSMFDIFSLQVPLSFQNKMQSRLDRLPGGRGSGVFLMGMFSALIVGPCIAAPLAGVLLFISQTGNVVLGGATLFALAWGSGTLLLIVGATSGSLMPKAGAWMIQVKYGFGLLLLATALWMVRSVLPSPIYVAVCSLLLLWTASLLGAFKSPSSSAVIHFSSAIGKALALWAALILIGVAMGSNSLTTPLKGFAGAHLPLENSLSYSPEKITSISQLEARLTNSSGPIMLTFFADWCSSCEQLVSSSFPDPEVQKRMKQFTQLEVDVTASTEFSREALKRFKLFGPPGIIFFNKEGIELTDVRVVGYMPAAQLAKELDKALGSEGEGA